MRYIYGAADIKYEAKKETKRVKKTREVASVFRLHPLLGRRPTFDHDECPNVFRANPLPLVELCATVVDQLPLPSVFEWTDMDIRRWIYRYGFPQYMNTFRVNMIWGRKLLLLDASALAAMNIKDFDHIKRITYGIRMLFHFELTKFSSGVSLPDEKPHELYLLWHTQTGIGYDRERNSDLLRRMQLIRERSRNLDHWDLLDLWLRRERERKHKVIVGYTGKAVLYDCPKGSDPKMDGSVPAYFTCRTCIPPCTCLWTEHLPKHPWRLQCLPRKDSEDQSRLCEHRCHTIPPCECTWRSKHYLTGTVLTCLKQKFSAKFAPNFADDYQLEIPEKVLSNWTRFSL